MKAETTLGALGQIFDTRKVSGIGLFAGRLTALLALMVGVPLLMVVLMSLRTGFPGEKEGALTLANLSPSTAQPVRTRSFLIQFSSP